MIIKDIYIIAIGRALQAIVSIATLRAITTFFEKNEIADYYLIYSIIFFYTYVTLGGFSAYFNRHLIESESHPHSQFTRYMRQVFLLGFMGIPINYLTLDFFINIENEKIFLVIFIIFSNVTFSTILRNLLTSINIYQNVKFFVLFNLLSLIFGIVLAVVITLNFEASIENWFIGLIIGEWLVLPVVYLRFRKLCNVTKKLSKQIYLPISTTAVLKFCGPLALTNLLVWSQMHAYRIITDKKIGSDLMSDLAVAIGVALAIFSMVETVVNQYFYPSLLRSIVDKPQAERVKIWVRIFKKGTIIYTNLAVFVMCSAQSLLILLTDKKFHDVYILTSFAAFMELGRVINNLFLLLFQSEKRTDLTILPYFVGAVTLLVCLLVFEIEATILNVVLALIVSHWSVTLYFIFRSKIVFNINFISLIMQVQKSRLVTLPIFVILMYISHLSYEFSFHLMILTMSLTLLGYSIYPYLEEQK